MPESALLRIAVIGAGPRGTSVVERLVAQLRQQPRPVRIDLIDPFEPGAGRVWRTDQSELYLMNTPSFFPTVVPDQGVVATSPTGLSFDAWRQRFRPELGRADYPSRAGYGQYLRWTFDELRRQLPDGVELRWHPSEALAVRRQAGGQAYSVHLESGERLEADAVVLALGHVPAELGREQSAFAEAAAQWRLEYFPPAIPADVDWAAVAAAEPVLVRGMGLNFFDLLSQWTEGRGGRFEKLADGLVYRPSGREPQIFAASRRGGPYRAKATLASYYPEGVSLDFLRAALMRPRVGLPGFEHDIWPALKKDTVRAYYSTRSAADAERLAAILQSDDWEARLQAFESQLPEPDRLDIAALAKPFHGRHFADQADFGRAVLEYLDADVAGSAAGESDPVKMAIGALNEGRALIKDFVADGGITEESWLRELRGWFESLVEGLASGPPALRIEQLAAAVRAGVVQFIGPDPVFAVDQDGFSASSPWVAGEPVRARQLVEAMAPANRVLQNASALLNQLLDEGLVRPKVMLAATDVPEVTSGLDVSAPPYRVLNADGAVQNRIYLIGLQLSSVQWGTAIAAEAGSKYRSGYRTLLDADAIAQDILNQDIRTR
ncbi:MAG: FAD/NAD(P)-binding protein [Renibacterium salmoninarum]|nr:FAD/NAD(P)-binding protein [Renibacterium salmoninarum]